MFADCYGFAGIGLRYFNVFGPRQDPDGAYAAVIPAWIGALLRGQTAYINGDGRRARDFCHVDNVVQANLLAAMTEDDGALNQAYNVAHGEQTSLDRAVRDHPRPAGEAPAAPEDGARGVPRAAARRRPLSRADICKAQRLLGYQPTVRLMDGLESTMDWYVANVAPVERRRKVG